MTRTRFFLYNTSPEERVNLRLKYVLFSGYPTDTPYPPLPFKHFKGFSSSTICPSRVRHGGHFYHSIYIILCVCSFLEHSLDPSMKSTCAEPHMSLVLMTDVSSIGATIAHLTSLPVQDGGPHDVRSKMAAPTTPRWRPPRNQDGGPCDAFGYTSEGESTP